MVKKKARRRVTSISKLTRNVAGRKRAVKRRRKRTPAPARVNPAASAVGWASGAGSLVVPGVLSYASTRLLGRIAYKLAKKKSANMARHAGALTPPLVAVSAWVAASKVDQLSPYRDGIIVGSTIAGIQALLQAYLPKYGWILNDYHLDDVLPGAVKVQPPALPPGDPEQPPIAYDEFDILEEEASTDDKAPPVDDLAEFYAGSLSN